MASRNQILPRTRAVTAGIIAMLIICPILFCGCLQVEPEELPPQAAAEPAAITISPTDPTNTTENANLVPPEIAITTVKQTGLYTEQEFPPEVEQAVNDFAGGKTTDTINGYLRWESVRARTNQSDASRIREQIRRIDYAAFNTTIKENISLYVGVTGEQVRRIRNDSVYEEPGYIIASYDPSVIYHKLANSGRDSEGYLTMCVVDFKRGSHLLFVNGTEREFLVPRGGIWDFAREEDYGTMEFSSDSIPRYGNIVPTKVRLIYTQEHP